MESTKRSLIDDTHNNEVDEEDTDNYDESVMKRSKRYKTPLTGIAVACATCYFFHNFLFLNSSSVIIISS